jgi:hypothetical protein
MLSRFTAAAEIFGTVDAPLMRLLATPVRG